MVITLTVCFNRYFGDKYSYLAYYTVIDFVSVGAFIISPQIYIERFGHANIILIHGLIRFFSVS